MYLESTFAERLPNVDPHDLEQAWRQLFSRAKLTQHHKVTRDELSVREHMTIILRNLAGRAFTEFSNLFEVGSGVAVLVVNFLAVLELVRESLIEVSQSEPFAPIYVKIANA